MPRDANTKRLINLDNSFVAESGIEWYESEMREKTKQKAEKQWKC